MNKPLAPVGTTTFSNPATMSGPLSADATAALVAAVGDVAFILSGQGVVLDAAISAGELACFVEWIGEPLIDTVTIESRPKIIEMLADATSADAQPRWRQVNHPFAGGDVPVRYLVMSLNHGEGSDRRLVAIGCDMRGAAAMQQRLLQTQQSLERDYTRLRQAETRYRLLFDTASEPVLIVDADTRRIREANPAAHRLLDVADGALIGEAIGTIAAADQRDDLIAYLGAAEATDDVAPLEVRLVDRRGYARVSARLFRQSRAPLLIVRIEPARIAVGTDRVDAALGNVVERMPDAFVLVDRDLAVLTANAAFLELAELPSLDRVVGGPLGQWLGRPGIDLELVVAQLREHGSVRNVATIFRGAAGAQEEVELSAVHAPLGDSDCYGFSIRNVARRLRPAPVIVGETPRSVEQLTELVGRMSLKEIVRESTDLIERLCIEAALVYTADNRASAAEILGVSRQSLYSKLHRHGLGNLVSSDD